MVIMLNSKLLDLKLPRMEVTGPKALNKEKNIMES